MRKSARPSIRRFVGLNLHFPPAHEARAAPVPDRTPACGPDRAPAPAPTGWLYPVLAPGHDPAARRWRQPDVRETYGSTYTMSAGSVERERGRRKGTAPMAVFRLPATRFRGHRLRGHRSSFPRKRESISTKSLDFPPSRRQAVRSHTPGNRTSCVNRCSCQPPYASSNRIFRISCSSSVHLMEHFLIEGSHETGQSMCYYVGQTTCS